MIRSGVWISLVSCIFILSVSLLTLGAKFALNERKVIRGQYQEISLRRLEGFQKSLEHLLAVEGKRLKVLLNQHGTPSALEELSQTEGLAVQAFNLDSFGQQIYAKGATTQQDAFLQRLNSVWFSPAFTKLQSTLAVEEGTFFPYFWTDGFHLLYLVHAEEGFRGVEVSKERLISKIIGALPRALPESLIESRVSLCDEQGKVWYSLGNLGTQTPEPFVSVYLAAPLQSFQFRQEVARGSWDRTMMSSALFTLIPAIVLVICLLGVLTCSFYRVHTREITESAQRVNFVNQVSHELKTPLTNIRMYAELLEERLDENDSLARRDLRIIVNESKRLSRLIQGVLTFGLLGRGKYSVCEQSVDLNQIVRNILEQFRPGLEKEGFLIQANLQVEGLSHIDADCVNQILANLISNAEKYAKAGHFLSIQASGKGECPLIIVSDRGPGIPSELHMKVFEPFFRISDGIRDGSTGTGIGLTISRDLARLHGGDLKILRSPVGATFLLTFGMREGSEVKKHESTALRR